MKKHIIGVILATAIFAWPQMTSSDFGHPPKGPTGTLVATQDRASALLMQGEEMEKVVGGAILGCQPEIEGNAVYYTCCANLWLFKICVSVWVGDLPTPPQ
jgi:hypothetical protein